MKKLNIIIAILSVVLISGCKSQEAKIVIRQIETIGEIDENTGVKLLDIEKNYNMLNDSDKNDVNNFSEYENAKENYSNFMYGNIKKMIQETNILLNDYFVQYFDKSKLDSSMAEAESVLKNSTVSEYKIVYDNLKRETKNLKNYLDQEKEKLFNKQTDMKNDADFPFAVDTMILETLNMEPVIKQTSRHPTWILTTESEVTDKPSYVNLFIDGSSHEYDYVAKNIPIKEIKIQNKNKEIQSALVNTEVCFMQRHRGINLTEETILNERPCYLLIEKNTENIYLALKNYDGEDYYVLYTFKE